MSKADSEILEKLKRDSYSYGITSALAGWFFLMVTDDAASTFAGRLMMGLSVILLWYLFLNTLQAYFAFKDSKNI